MLKHLGYDLPESWEDVTIKQFSDYNVALQVYKKDCEDFKEREEEATELEQMITESKLKAGIMSAFTGVSKEDLETENLHVIRDYVSLLLFIHEDRKDKILKSFTFKGVEYFIPENLALETKFGQYINSLQAEMVSQAKNPSNMEFLSHQIAHTVKGNMSEEERDKLAEEFLELPSTIAMDFAFFLDKQLEIFSLAALTNKGVPLDKKNESMKKLLEGSVGLSPYMKSQSRVSLMDKVKVGLNVLKIRAHQMFYSTSTIK
jgi:hypothetical protein